MFRMFPIVCSTPHLMHLGSGTINARPWNNYVNIFSKNPTSHGNSWSTWLQIQVADRHRVGLCISKRTSSCTAIDFYRQWGMSYTIRDSLKTQRKSYLEITSNRFFGSSSWQYPSFIQCPNKFIQAFNTKNFIPSRTLKYGILVNNQLWSSKP